MKVYISADMEGVSGVVHPEHTQRDGKEHDRARDLMSHEVHASIEGAYEGGARKVIVNDSHGTMRNIIHEYLQPDVDLISGSPKQLAMMEGIDTTFDAAFFIGYHTRMGNPGVLDHTFSSASIKRITINDIEYGEFGLNALVAGYYDIPVVLVSGCNKLAEEAEALVPNIESAVVKHTINRTAALNRHPETARAMLRQASRRALTKTKQMTSLRPDQKLTAKVEFLNTGMADIAETLPILERITPLTVTFETHDMIRCYRLIRSLISLVN